MFDTKNIFSILFDELGARPDLVRTRPDFGPDMSGPESGLAKCVTCDIDFYDCQYITNDNYLVSGWS